MFWRVQGEEQTSPVEKILNRDSFTLEDLLLEEDVIQEVKAMNERLIEYLKQGETVGELAKYVVEPLKSVVKLEERLQAKKLRELEEEEGGDSDDDEDDAAGDKDGEKEEGDSVDSVDAAGNQETVTIVSPKILTPEQEAKRAEIAKPMGEEELQHYALQSAQRVCEILCCEVDEIFTELTCEENLDYLFTFLDQPKPVDSVLSGYYSRVMVSIAQRRSAEIGEYIQQKPEILRKLVDHLYSYSITEFILRLISGDEQNALYQKEQGNEWLIKTQLLDFLVEKVTQPLPAMAAGDAKDAELEKRLAFNTVSNAVSCIVGIANTAPSAIASQLQEQQVIEALLQAVSGDSPAPVLIAVVDIFIAMLQPRQTKQTLSPDVIISYGGFSPVAVEETIDQGMVDCAGMIMEKLDGLCSMLEPTEGEGAFETSYGKVATRFGMRRWKILDLISKVVNIVDADKCVRITKETKIIQTCFAMMYEMPFNSMLHNVVQNIIFGMLATENRELMVSLIENCKLHHLVSQAAQEIDSQAMALHKDDKPLRAGYFGVVTQVANQILGFAATDTEVEKILEDDLQWTAWVVNVLVPQNKLEDPTSWECGRPSRANDILGDVGMGGGAVDLSLYSGLGLGASSNDNGYDDDDDNDGDDFLNDEDGDEDEDEEDIYDTVDAFQRLSTEGEDISDEISADDPASEKDDVVLVSSEDQQALIQEKQQLKRADTPAGIPQVMDSQFNSANFWRSPYTFDLPEDESSSS